MSKEGPFGPMLRALGTPNKTTTKIRTVRPSGTVGMVGATGATGMTSGVAMASGPNGSRGMTGLNAMPQKERDALAQAICIACAEFEVARNQTGVILDMVCATCNKRWFGPDPGNDRRGAIEAMKAKGG